MAEKERRSEVEELKKEVEELKKRVDELSKRFEEERGGEFLKELRQRVENLTKKLEVEKKPTLLKDALNKVVDFGLFVVRTSASVVEGALEGAKKSLEEVKREKPKGDKK